MMLCVVSSNLFLARFCVKGVYRLGPKRIERAVVVSMHNKPPQSLPGSFGREREREETCIRRLLLLPSIPHPTFNNGTEVNIELSPKVIYEGPVCRQRLRVAATAIPRRGKARETLSILATLAEGSSIRRSHTKSPI